MEEGFFGMEVILFDWFLITQIVFWGCCVFACFPSSNQSCCDQSSSWFWALAALAFTYDNKQTTWKQNYACMICVYFHLQEERWHCFTRNPTRTWSDAKQDNRRISMCKPEGFCASGIFWWQKFRWKKINKKYLNCFFFCFWIFYWSSVLICASQAGRDGNFTRRNSFKTTFQKWLKFCMNSQNKLLEVCKISSVLINLKILRLNGLTVFTKVYKCLNKKTVIF